VKINLLLPVALRQEADAVAENLGVSRSRLIKIALEQFLEERRGHDFGGYDSGLREESEAWPTHDREQRRRMERQAPSRKTVVSLPAGLIENAKAAAKHLRISQSKLVETALERFLRRGRESAIKAVINRYAAEQGDLSEEDEVLLEHARQMTRRVEWNE
jgi:metal-responsive CopG/Arc/MetJ family transcriptional regulator